MKSIIGNSMLGVLESFSIAAKMTFCGNIGGLLGKVEVWEMPDSEYETFVRKSDEISEENWESRYADSWWRSANGSNQKAPDKQYVINGKPLIAWDNMNRGNDDMREEYDDYLNECDDFGEEQPMSYEAWEEDYYPRKYDNLAQYLCDEMGASNCKNVSALVSDLAKYNNMSIAELLKNYCTAE